MGRGVSAQRNLWFKAFSTAFKINPAVENRLRTKTKIEKRRFAMGQFVKRFSHLIVANGTGA